MNRADAAHAPAAVVAAAAVCAALFEYADGELRCAIDCLGWRGGRLHGGVHQARKSIRRVRATLALGQPVLGAGARLIDRELRRINDDLSDLRDAHALVVALDVLGEQVDDPEQAAFLRRQKRIAAIRRAAHARMRLAAEPALGETRDLLAALRGALAALDWKRVADVDASIARSRGNVAAAAAIAAASDGANDEDWHRWRRRARRLSQQQRALGHAGDAEDRRAHKLAVTLGKAQDLSLIVEHCGKRSPFAREDRRRLRTIARAQLDALRQRIARSLAAPLIAAAPEHEAGVDAAM